MNYICTNCIRRFDCVGIQFDFYLQDYVCPHNIVHVVTDNKTTMTDYTYVSNSTVTEDSK